MIHGDWNGEVRGEQVLSRVTVETAKSVNRRDLLRSHGIDSFVWQFRISVSRTFLKLSHEANEKTMYRFGSP